MPADAPARLLTVTSPLVGGSPDHGSFEFRTHPARFAGQASAARARRRPLLATALSRTLRVEQPCPPRGSEAPRRPLEAPAEVAGAALVNVARNDQCVDSGLWETLVDGNEVVLVEAGALLHEPTAARPLLAILEGVVRVYIAIADGRQVTLRYARAGDLVGLPAALSSGPHTTTAAVTNTAIARLSLDHLRELSTLHAHLAWPLAKQMARWSSEVDLALIHVDHGSMTARIAGHLLESATTKPGAGTQACISHGHLALAAGTVREVASRSLGELRQAGIVITHRGTVVIVDRPRLARVAHGDERLAKVQGRGSSSRGARAAMIPLDNDENAGVKPTASSAGALS